MLWWCIVVSTGLLAPSMSKVALMWLLLNPPRSSLPPGGFITVMLFGSEIVTETSARF